MTYRIYAMIQSVELMLLGFTAGIVRDSSFGRMSKDQWDAVYKVHLEGTMRCAGW